MSWILDEQQRLLSDSARDFFEAQSPVAQLRALRDAADVQGYQPSLWRAFGEQGYSAVLVPEAHGGMALGVCDASLIAEQIGHTLAPSPWFSTAVLAASLLKSAGSAAQQAAWLPRIAVAQTVVAVAIDERSRHRPDAITTTATQDGSGWRIDGEKLFVIDGHVADAIIVAARAPQGIALLLVDKSAAGLTIERTSMVDAHNAARLKFSGVKVGADALLADNADGGYAGNGKALDAMLDIGRVIAASDLIGIADEVFERTVQYLKERKQFDRTIGEFQALQHRAAELFCDLELTRAMVRQAAKSIDDGAAEAPLHSAQAKARACLTANRAVQEAVQMHGGIGMTDELEIGFFMKRARVLQELFGDAAFQIDRAAGLSGY